MPRWVNERALVALALLVSGAALTFSTFGGSFADLGGAFSPMFFPRIVLTLLLALALVNLTMEWVRPTPSRSIRVWPVAVIAVTVVIYVWLVPRYGFFLCSVALSLSVLLVLGVRRPLPVGLVALGLPAALVGLFNHVLKMPLPTSPVVWWL